MLKLRQSKDDQNGAILVTGIIVLIGLVIGGLVLIWVISTIAGAIVPLAIFMILAIVLILLVKKILYGGESLGIVKGISGAGREAGKETLGLMKGVGREFKGGGWF